jgi:hypothetical protein
MGAEMTAFIEYDTTPDVWCATEPIPAPFSFESGEPFSLTGGGGLYTGSKDYRFFAAIAGVRNETGIPPLIPLRGAPPNPSLKVLAALDSRKELADYCTGWLRLSEINAALEHQHTDRNLLNFETKSILAIMGVLVQRLGDEWVRLVFGFDS